MLMLREAGFDPASLYITNVFKVRPPQNKINTYFVGKQDLPDNYTIPMLSKGMYVHPDLVCALDELYDEIESVDPNVIIALGGTALWAVTGLVGINKNRGTVTPYAPLTRPAVAQRKVIATMHPAAILRNWSSRPIAVIDLMKAKRHADSREFVRPARKIWIMPDISDVRNFFKTEVSKADIVSVDIETRKGFITCIGIAPRTDLALVVPLFDKTKPGGMYWSFDEFVEVLTILRGWLASPQEKLFQNGMYDVQYIWKTLRCPVFGFHHDTMLCHHALQPEMQKDLGFLGSVYTDEASWKGMRGFKTLKKDD